jgi:hypothetical protein
MKKSKNSKIKNATKTKTNEKRRKECEKALAMVGR